MEITPVCRFQGWGLSTYAMLIWRTARYQVLGQEHIEQDGAAGRPLIVAAWHGMTMMLTGYLVAHESASRLNVIVPDDSRGAALSIWAQRVGISPFVISMEADSMVAARRLLELIRRMKQGENLYVNPDGPAGPSHEPKDGVIFIARKTGALIVPAGAFTATCYCVPRWDRYTVPFPFSRIAVALGKPFEVLAEVDSEQARALLRGRLNEAEQAARELYRKSQ